MPFSFNIVIDKVSWVEVLKKFESYDFYHTYDYHQLSKKNNEKPVLLHYSNKENTIALPLLIRPIDDTGYFDATSVYGYAGPLTNTIKTKDFSDFKSSLLLFFKQENIVSVFSRLNPFIPNQENVLLDFGSLTKKGKVVNIDITKSVEESRAAYSKSTKSRVNKAKKKCYIKTVSSVQEIDVFIDIYYENMRRLNANKDYFFSREYFLDFLNCTDFNTQVLMVFDAETNTAIAASMFIKTNNIVQFHLSGTRNDFLEIAPARIFIDEMRIIATEENYSYFNLGGGLGGNDDSLFEFKSSFSKDFKDFYLWSLIVQPEVYDNLCRQNPILNDDSEGTISFFPLYRYGTES